MIVKLFGATVFGSALWLLYRFEQADMATGIQLFFWPAILLTFAGPFGMLMFSTDLEQIGTVVSFFFRESLTKARRNLDQEYSLLRRLGGEFYARGPRAFEVKNSDISPHISRMLERLSIRIPILDAYDMLERDRDQLADRLEQGISLMTLGGRLSPSIGMLGTIIGMSQLLSHLKDPENIGASMSVALLTTFYGLFFSLSLWTPLQNHLHRLLDLRMRSFDQALHWLDLLQKRKPADYMGDQDVALGTGAQASASGSDLPL